MNIPITIFSSKQGGYTVVSNFLNFVTEGETMEEAMENAKEAIACHLEGLKKSKDEYEQAYLHDVEQSFNTFIAV